MRNIIRCRSPSLYNFGTLGQGSLRAVCRELNQVGRAAAMKIDLGVHVAPNSPFISQQRKRLR